MGVKSDPTLFQIATGFVSRWQVARIVDHPSVSHCNPNNIQQPNIMPDKLLDMWKTAKAKWNTPHMHWSSDSGNHEPWINFCGGNRG